MKKPALHWQVIIGLVLGLVYSYFAVHYDWSLFTLYFIAPFGDIFINLLKMIAVPLVLFSIIVGIISLKDLKGLGKVGVKTLIAYLLTTVFAVGLGLLLVNVIGPGKRTDEKLLLENRIRYELWKNQTNANNSKAELPPIKDLDDRCESCKPENRILVDSIAAKMGTESVNKDVKDKLDKAEKEKAKRQEKGPLQPLVDIVPENIFVSMSSAKDMLQVIFFGILFGIVIISLPRSKTEPVVKLIEGLNEIFVKMIWIIMQAMPVFVFALMAGQVVKAAGSDPEKFQELLTFLLRYSITVVIGLGILIFLIYPLLVRLFTKMRYGKFMSGIKDAQLTAFSTSSSVATLPVTMDCIEHKMGVSKSVTSFVLPIGATVNMDGTSLYQAVAVVAMAQFHWIDLSIGQQAIIIVTATLASIGAAAVPSAGLVLMILVLESVGLNGAWIALIFPVDRILDMCRTVVNVTGDATVSTIIANSEGELNIPETRNE